MKNFTKTVATFALVAAVTVSLGSAPALAAENPAPFRTGEHPAFSVRAGNDRRNWKPCEMTEEEKAARIENFKAKLAEKLAAGEITQEKYDEIIANMESGNFPPIKGSDGSVKPKFPKMPIK